MSVNCNIPAYLKLMRAPNCAMAAFAALIGWLITYSLLGGNLLSSVLVFAVVFLITGAGNALNDYFDIGIDRINRPERPLPSGAITLDAARNFSVILFIIGIVLAYFLGTLCFIIAILNSVILTFYASHLKQTVLWGNVSVGYLTGSTFLFGSAVFGLEGVNITMVLFLLSTLATISREIVKDVEDIEGDSAKGARTFPIVFGEKKALYLSAVLVFISVLLSPLPYFQVMPDGKTLFNWAYLLIVAFADIFFIASILTSCKQVKGFSCSTLLKLAMFIALLAFITGALLR